nr:immunoglobulin light chain junction region [Macaca mulatta]
DYYCQVYDNNIWVF